MRLLAIAAVAAVFAVTASLFAAEIHDAAGAGDVALIREILEGEPGAVAERDDRNDTPLHHAARAGRTEAVRLLLDSGAPIDVGDNENSTALDVASQGGWLETVALLLDRGADVGHRDDFGMTALLFAAFNGQADVTRFLIENGADADVRRTDGVTALGAAAWNGSEPVARLLIDAGADVNARSEAGRTPLLSAAGGRGGIDVPRLLIDSGADVHDRDGEGSTALHLAASRGQTEVMELLIDNGLPVDVETDFGWTPLFMTSIGGHIDAARLLLDRGADVNVSGSDGVTPLMRALDHDSMELSEFLLSRGADADAVEDESGRTLLHFAALRGDADLARFVLAHGASIDPVDDFSMTPIRYAAKYGHRDVAELLASRGAVAHGLEENYGRPKLLDRDVGRGEAALWYLGHCGWAVKTENHFLIFDYWTRDNRPAAPSLTNGYIAPLEIADENVYVFVSHEHADHYDPAIFEWADAIDGIAYVYGFRPEALPANREAGYTGPPYEYLGPREHAEMDGISIRTIKANDAGVGFLVGVDGLVIYHAGDHAGWADGEKDGYLSEIDYLDEYVDEPDIAFLNVTGCHAHDPDRLFEGNVYTLGKLEPKVMIPTHSLLREIRYVEAAERLAESGAVVSVVCPDNRGDSFYYGGDGIE